MEYDKINNLLLSKDNVSEQLSKFVNREYVRVNSLLNTYIIVKGTIKVTTPGVNNDANNITGKRNRSVILKNNAPFVSCITRINGELIEDADDLDIVMSMYNLLEYSKTIEKL